VSPWRRSCGTFLFLCCVFIVSVAFGHDFVPDSRRPFAATRTEFPLSFLGLQLRLARSVNVLVFSAVLLRALGDMLPLRAPSLERHYFSSSLLFVF